MRTPEVHGPLDWLPFLSGSYITPKGHYQVNGERAQLTLKNGFTAYLISSSLPSCPDVRGVTSSTETHLTAEPSEGRKAWGRATASSNGLGGEHWVQQPRRGGTS